MSSTTASPTAPSAATRPRHPILLRIALVLTLLLGLLAVIPAVFDFGFDGTGWDAVVVIVAIATPLMAIALLVLVPLAWNGRRGPCWGVIAVQLLSILPALPPYLHAPGELPPSAAISATIGIALTLVLAALVWRGMRPAEG